MWLQIVDSLNFVYVQEKCWIQTQVIIIVGKVGNIFLQILETMFHWV